MKALIIYLTNGSEPSHSEAVQSAFVAGGGVTSDLYNISSFNQTVVDYAKTNNYDAIIYSYSGEESYFSLAESNPDVMIFMPSDNYNGDLQQLVLTSNFYNVNVFENNDFRDWTLELGMSATQTTLTNGYAGVNFAHVSNCLEVGKRYRLKLIVSNNSNYADSRIVSSPFGTEIVAITKNTTTDTLVDFVATTTDLYVEMPYTGTLTFTAFELIADSREFTDYTQSALSSANGYICGQLFYIAEQRNCTLQEARICANLTKDVEGIINVASAISYSGTITLTVGSLTAVRGVGQIIQIDLDHIIDATNYRIYRNNVLIYEGILTTYIDSLPIDIIEAEYTYEGYSASLISERSNPSTVYRGRDQYLTMGSLLTNSEYWELTKIKETIFTKEKTPQRDLKFNPEEKISVPIFNPLLVTDKFNKFNTLDELDQYVYNPSAESMRFQASEDDNNFWNKPLPKGLKTIKNFYARFKSSYNFTHTSFYKRKAFLKLEVETAGGGTSLIDLGAFIFGKIDNERDSNTITLEDLAKPLIEQPADKIKAGYQWYRNVPVNFLVEELVKSVYYDQRNGELPRDYIIQSVRPETPNNDFLLSSQGKPPLFTRLTNNLSAEGVTRVLVSGDIDGGGELLYLGIGSNLWSFNELTQTYFNIGRVESSSGSNELVIKKLWVKSSKIYGVALEEEQLVATNPYEPLSKNDCQIATEFIFFEATRDGIVTLFDSQSAEDFNNFKYKTFSGEYHIVPPYFKSEVHTLQDYVDLYGQTPPMYPIYHTAPDLETDWIIPDADATMYTIISGIGNFKDPTITTAGSNKYKYPQTENITIPFAQNVGFVCNRGLENYGFSTGRLYKDNDLLDNVDNFGVQAFPNSIGITPIEKVPASKRSRIVINHLLNWGDSSIRYTKTSSHTSDLTSFIIQTYWPSGWYVNSSPEIFESELPSLEYGLVEEYYRILPYQSTVSINFQPGHFGWSEESYAFSKFSTLSDTQVTSLPDPSPVDLNLYFRPALGYEGNFTWKKVSWPWVKFTSGQKGAIEYLPSVGTNGSIVFQALVKGHNYGNSPTDIGRKRMQQIDLAYPLDQATKSVAATPRDMVFKLFLFDLETKAFTELPLDDTEDQITAMTPNGTDLYVATINFNHSTDNSGNSDLSVSKYNQALINKYNLSNLGSITKTLLYDSKQAVAGSKTLEEQQTRTITDLLYINSTLLVSNYIRANVVDTPGVGYSNIPEIGRPFSIGKLASLTSLNTAITSLDAKVTDTSGNLIKLAPSKLSSTKFYFVDLQNRTELVNKGLLKSYDLSDDSVEILGHIEDVAFGDSNLLSNILASNLTGESYEIIYGITSGYYINPINRITSKNYLFKFDKYLSGIIELADFSNLKVWDVLTKLAEAFNFLVGFDNDKFFFVPKTLGEPDIFIDIDTDDLISVKKTQNFEVSNIISTIPYKSQLGEIQWSITLTDDDIRGTLDSDRTKLSVNLRIRQDDNLQKNIVLKTIQRGQLPDNDGTYEIYNASGENEFTNLRFAYLVYNGVLETKLYRDVASNESTIVLPSFYGDNLATQLGIGDVFVINYQDPDTDATVYISKIIVGVNFTSNEIELDSALGHSFEAYTSVSIYKAAALDENGSTKLRNNYWSSEGVTFLTDDIIHNYYTLPQLSMSEIGAKVMSLQNLSIGTVILVGEATTEYIITNTFYIDQQPYIAFKRFNTLKNTGTPLVAGSTGNTKSIIRAYWVPIAPSASDDALIEVGGSKIFVGFEKGSVGTFWTNTKGEDRIDINCPGLELTSDTSSKFTAVNIESTKVYGNQEETLDDNRFIQKNLVEFIARTYLGWKAQPKLSFEIKNFVQALNRSGQSYSLPISKLVNTQSRKLHTVRIRSKRFLPYFKDYSIDCYLMDYDINTNDFSQSLKIRSVSAY